jgi:hypothetical protein
VWETRDVAGADAGCREKPLREHRKGARLQDALYWKTVLRNPKKGRGRGKENPARLEGFEPPTFSFEGCRSIHLSYRRAKPVYPKSPTTESHLTDCEPVCCRLLSAIPFTLVSCAILPPLTAGLWAAECCEQRYAKANCCPSRSTFLNSASTRPPSMRGQNRS